MFQSTHSLRSATRYARSYPSYLSVSIHALLAECDKTARNKVVQPFGFNPRTPCGVRHFPGIITLPTLRFQSTHSLRSATFYSLTHFSRLDVSIHALLAECDTVLLCLRIFHIRFNPRTPCGVRLVQQTQNVILTPVSIHALLAECDCA